MASLPVFADSPRSATIPGRARTVVRDGATGGTVVDGAAIEGLYVRYGALVLRRARAILGEEQAARDAMQEVFVRALTQGSSFRNEASPVTWLYRITTNLCLNRVRDASRRRELLAAQGPAHDEAPEASPETKVALAALLRRVPEELREIAVYYFVDEMSHDEIAGILGVSRRTVGNRLEAFRAAARSVVEEPARKKEAR